MIFECLDNFFQTFYKSYVPTTSQRCRRHSGIGADQLNYRSGRGNQPNLKIGNRVVPEAHLHATYALAWRGKIVVDYIEYVKIICN